MEAVIWNAVEQREKFGKVSRVLRKVFIKSSTHNQKKLSSLLYRNTSKKFIKIPSVFEMTNYFRLFLMMFILIKKLSEIKFRYNMECSNT